MTNAKIFAGHTIRRLRRAQGVSQSAMAGGLGISPSYLNLIERNQRPLTAALMLKLAERYDLDTKTLAADEPGGGIDRLRARLAQPLFADLDIDRGQIADWIASAPATAEAFARIADRLVTGEGGSLPPGPEQPMVAVYRAIQRWSNYFADLDAQAESLGDELRLGSGDLYGAIAERLRLAHRLNVRVLPVEVMPDRLRRLDLHARELQLSELLDPASRTFAAAFQLGQIEAKSEIEALVRGAALSDRAAERLFRRHLTSSFAGALMMPYQRFLRACEATGYDVELLQRRFGAGFEQIAHRMTSLQRVGARGLPFFMVRLDRSGQVSKRYAGASGSPLARTSEGVHNTRCPLWIAYQAFDRPGTLVRQLAALEDGSRWFTMARTVTPQGARLGGPQALFSIVLGLDAALATPLAAARGLDLKHGGSAIGLGCTRCMRPDCPQRSAPPVQASLTFNDRERGISPFTFHAD